MKLITGAILILVWTAMLFIATAPTVAQVVAPNEVWWAGAYCTNEISATRLARAMADGGAVGYGITIMALDVQCYDVEILNQPPPRVTLLEKQWQIVTPDGQKVDFWTAVDKRGVLGWVWLFVDDGV